MTMRCLHGLDARFCAVCNKASAFGSPRGAIGAVTLADIERFLDSEDARATRRAVGDALGIGAPALRAVGSPRIVDAGDDDVIASGTALLMRMTAWKARHPI
jgi:hypothetical protein